MTLSPRFEDALVFAARLHAGEVRKGTTIPYVSHVLGVASLAVEPGADEDDAIAALLHDTGEDARGDPGVIRLRELGDIRLFAYGGFGLLRESVQPSTISSAAPRTVDGS